MNFSKQRRGTRRGELGVRIEHLGKSKRILVSLEAVLTWVQTRSQVDEQAPVHEQGEQVRTEQAEQREQAEQGPPSSMAIPLQAHLAALELVGKEWQRQTTEERKRAEEGLA